MVSGIRELKDLFVQLEAETTTKNLAFIDEIHRFNKAQQDAFLPYMEKGVITQFGTTTMAGHSPLSRPCFRARGSSSLTPRRGGDP